MSNKLKKGFTLVELVVVLLLMGIITTAIVMVLQPVSNLSVDINNKSSEETGAITLFDYINGELRYATNVSVVSTDDDTAIPSSEVGNNKNFIMLSNKTRPTSKKGARGYTKHGLTSQFNKATACVSDAILDENDFQFRIDGFITDPKSESLSIGVTAHPMKASFTGFSVNEDKPYEYTETFQLVNMQNRDRLSTNRTIGALSTTRYDSSKAVIWIFYEKPAESATSGSIGGSGSGTAGVGELTTAQAGKKEIDLTVNTAVLTVHFQMGNDTGKNQYKFFKTGSGDFTVYKSDNTKDDNQQQHYASNSGDTVKTVFFDENSELTIKVNNDSETIDVISYDDVKNGLITEIWLYDWQVHSSAYVPPAAINKTITVHYIKGMNSITSGMKIKDEDGMQDSLMINGAYYNGDWGYECDNNSSVDLPLRFLKEGAAVNVYNRPSDSYVGTINADSVADGGEVWFFNGVIYYDYNDVPPMPAPILEIESVSEIDRNNKKFSITIKNNGNAVANAWDLNFNIPFDYNQIYINGLNNPNIKDDNHNITIETNRNSWGYANILPGETYTIEVGYNHDWQYVIPDDVSIDIGTVSVTHVIFGE